jgi:hypothetical protein
MPTVHEVFQPLIGKLAWQVRRGYGSFLTMEFGDPHLEIRQPRALDASAPHRVRENFARRRVTVVGQWHFWIQYCDWVIKTPNHAISSEKTDNPDLVDACLEELDGQALTAVEEDAVARCRLQFDLGGVIDISPSTEDSGSTDESDKDLWAVHCHGGPIFLCRANGQVLQNQLTP